ncbi:MAG TPA: nickel pincer cofactor biosynthesis protein LarC [Gemmatimonadaceae bacterium]|nr:nickel pincer cofactor biosynthesis protein LarC [Gemmatimonadaceae bacterium]
MTIAILDPFSGIAGDMLLGALVDVGLDTDWLQALPHRLGLDGVSVRIERVRRAGIASVKVDFEIPPQPHGRHIGEMRALVAHAELPSRVRERADAAFMGIATAEGAIHGVPPDKVHLHEVGAVDAILDVVGGIWGMETLGVDAIYCAPVTLGDGTVEAAHGTLPVPAPATLKLLEGIPVRPGPEGAGELVTPTGAALVRVLSSGAPPARYVPLRSGYGAGTRDPRGRPNVLRVVVADAASAADWRAESIERLSCEIDDMPAEYLAAAADRLRSTGALDVLLLPVMMKKGRPGTRLEVLCDPADAESLLAQIFRETTSIGVRRERLERLALPRHVESVQVLEHRVRVKAVRLPGGAWRAKPEADDVLEVSRSTGRSFRDVFGMASAAGERMLTSRVEDGVQSSPTT